MNKYALGTIIGTALLGLFKAKRGGRNYYKPDNIEDIYQLSAQEKAQITELNLRNMRLIHLPDDIFDGFTNLEELYLRYNQLTELPQSLGNLTNLRWLELYKNELTELPEWIGNLTNLEHLNLGDNQLTELPESIGNLTNLEGLDLGDNELKEFPEWIGNLTNLVYLGFYINKLTELPESFGNLTNLEILWLNDNGLTELPESFGDFANLERLLLDDNPWQKPVPKETILKMIRNGVSKDVIEKIIDINNSIPSISTKSNLRIR